jgi:peptidoglycan hydrolase-like protein with peptidoglycan-binding domain
VPFYSPSAYGSNPHAGVNRNNASARGWGPGWSSCQSRKQVKVSKGGVTVFVRREIAPLVAYLLDATERLGYDILTGQTWGFACRPIRGTRVASNHSWGLAVDVNSLSNPMQSTFKSNIPPRVVAMWESAGFYWGGRYQRRPDAMHFEYIKRPADVGVSLSRAQAYFGRVSRGSSARMAPPVPGPGVRGAYPLPTGHMFGPNPRRRATWHDGSKYIDASAASRFKAGDVTAIRSIQREVGARDDGVYGEATTAAVKQYQSRLRGHATHPVNLAVDGVVGPQTWAAMTRRGRA